MSSTNSGAGSRTGDASFLGSSDGPVTRRSTETKASFKTTEFMAYVFAAAAVIVTALVVGDDGNGGGDPFGAIDAIRYLSYLTIGYMVARGLAKAGSREHVVADGTVKR